jgi:hypothetical protein
MGRKLGFSPDEETQLKVSEETRSIFGIKRYDVKICC